MTPSNKPPKRESIFKFRDPNRDNSLIGSLAIATGMGFLGLFIAWYASRDLEGERVPYFVFFLSLFVITLLFNGATTILVFLRDVLLNIWDLFTSSTADRLVSQSKHTAEAKAEIVTNDLQSPAIDKASSVISESLPKSNYTDKFSEEQSNILQKTSSRIINQRLQVSFYWGGISILTFGLFFVWSLFLSLFCNDSPLVKTMLVFGECGTDNDQLLFIIYVVLKVIATITVTALIYSIYGTAHTNMAYRRFEFIRNLYLTLPKPVIDNEDLLFQTLDRRDLDRNWRNELESHGFIEPLVRFSKTIGWGIVGAFGLIGGIIGLIVLVAEIISFLLHTIHFPLLVFGMLGAVILGFLVMYTLAYLFTIIKS